MWLKIAENTKKAVKQPGIVYGANAFDRACVFSVKYEWQLDTGSFSECDKRNNNKIFRSNLSSLYSKF